MKKLKITIFVILVLVLIWIGVDRIVARSAAKQPVIYGVSFQPDYADYLTGNYQDVFKTVLDDWGFRYIRLSARWSEVEGEKDKFDFTRLDWLMGEAQKRDAKILLAIGQKTPRWPECHAPEWTKSLNDEEYFSSLEKYIKAVVEHYKNNSALEIWQVENEPFLPFGESCRKLSSKKFKEEISWVRVEDGSHKILTADSGELSTWFRTAQAADYFGTTLYQMVWNQYIGYWSYDWLPASFYRLKLWVNGRVPKDTFVVELQAEPWLPDNAIENVPIEEQNKSMNLKRLQSNLQYARRLGFSRDYLWGAEWWYWLQKQGLNEIPEFIKNLEGK
jgi:hypothetical protein